MNYLLDTHLLIWSADCPSKLSPKATHIIKDLNNTLFFSVVSLWEIAIKASRHKEFYINASVLRTWLLNNEFIELPITGEHTLQIAHLPHIHGDPFDRMLIAQAVVEGMSLVTHDGHIQKYSAPIIPV